MSRVGKITVWCLATFVFAGAGASSASTATADRPDPRGLPKPYTGPPLLRSTPGPSPWLKLLHRPPISPGSMLLMSDGTVFVHQDDTRLWAQLVPDRRGSYVHGHWRRVASLPPGYRPEYFSSAVVRDGRLIVFGGEYDGGNRQVETASGAVYAPATNTWKTVAGPPGWTEIGDAQSTLLADGRLLMADLNGSGAAELDPATMRWISTGSGKFDPNSEEGFSLLPDGRVLTVDSAARDSELFDPTTGAWSTAGVIPTQLIGADSEQGPLVSGPDGTVFAVGATGHTALYHPLAGAVGKWSVGPELPVINRSRYVSADAAGARLPNGNVLFDASPPGQIAPTHFFVFNGHRLTLLDDNTTATDVTSYNTRMLVLPTGQVLYDDSEKIYVFRSKGAPQAVWRPSIGSVPARLARGRTYTLSGHQLAGRDQGAAYGDDFQDDTNYPIVRIVNVKSETVTYARTHNWSSFSTAPNVPSTTQFSLPRGTPAGSSEVVVVANGVASRPVRVMVTR